MADRWRVQLAPEARADIAAIVQWTGRQFGSQQSAAYAEAVSAALRSIAANPRLATTRMRGDVVPGLRSLHVRVFRARARHVVFYRLRRGVVIVVLRVLHDNMDVRLHFGAET